MAANYLQYVLQNIHSFDFMGLNLTVWQITILSNQKIKGTGTRPLSSLINSPSQFLGNFVLQQYLNQNKSMCHAPLS